MDLCLQQANPNKTTEDVLELWSTDDFSPWVSKGGGARQGRANLGTRPAELSGIGGDPRDSFCGWGLAHKYRAATRGPPPKMWGWG